MSNGAETTPQVSGSLKGTRSFTVVVIVVLVAAAASVIEYLEYSPRNSFSNLKQHYSAALGLGALLSSPT